jgi:hypothetical protein
MGKELVVEEKKGDIFKEVTMGTFLTRLDRFPRLRGPGSDARRGKRLALLIW